MSCPLAASALPDGFATVGRVMSVTFSIPIDTIPDALDLEPDVPGLDWIEDDPDLEAGPIHLYVHGSSTAVLTIAVTDEMTLEVRVPLTASPTDWGLAFDVIELAMEQAETVLVELDGGEPFTIDELREHCDATWQQSQAASATKALRLLTEGGPVQAPGPIRSAHLGSRVMAELAADEADDDEQGRRLLAVLRRVQWVTGPHDRAVALHIPDADGRSHSVAVIGPDLRYVLPPTDHLLVENGDLADDAAELVIPSEALTALPGITVQWLDDGNRLMEAVPESQWPLVIEAAAAHRIAGPKQ